MLLVSMLEHLCSLYETDQEKRNKLFKGKTNTLFMILLQIVSGVSWLDEFGSVREQYKKAFSNLVSTAVESLLFQDRYRNLIARPGPPQDAFQTFASRYANEFLELDRLGKGGFGRVFKVKNKLDGQEYAVKKIFLKESKMYVFFRIVREVKLLASLQHANVVRYHTAWMEYSNPAMTNVHVRGSFTGLSSVHSDKDNVPCLVDTENRATVEDINRHVEDVQQLDKRNKESPVDTVERESGKSSEKTSELLDTIPWETAGKERADNNSEKDSTLLDTIPWESSRKEDKKSKDTIQWESPERGKEESEKIDQTGVVLYIQMQLCQRSLRDWLVSRNTQAALLHGMLNPFGGVSEDDNMRLFQQILQGVNYIHSQGLMHRDLKPPNIFLIGEDDHVCIGDFGLAREDLRDTHGSSPPLTPLEMPDVMAGETTHTSGVGTCTYASPEQLKGTTYNSKSDMYSMGVILFELFHPFGTEMERAKSIQDFREGRVLPQVLVERWPRQCDFMQLLTSDEPKYRPSAKDILKSDLFQDKDKVIANLKAMVDKQSREMAELRRQLKEREDMLLQLRRDRSTH
uniref:Eukaryotic translation initiation factor 2-alpha kinase 1 n=1 Tax=Branchiostoma floridae TaxID=7739 RepID=C3Z0Y4_BRAFL|eukprot:XP_002597671.1 hypothetical protein BRAFLDRAFT_279796 [Branchiostoma floridae]